jgi:hypothetical protein
MHRLDVPAAVVPAKAGTQYSRAPEIKSLTLWDTGCPLEPVIGLARGETRLAGMTVEGYAAADFFDTLGCIGRLRTTRVPV